MLDPTDDMPIFETSGPVPLTYPAQPPYGELSMLRAEMDDAQRCFLGLCGTPIEQIEARQWVRSGARFVFSFEWVCEMLRLDASAVRRQFERQYQNGMVRRWRLRSNVRHGYTMKQVA